MCIRDSTYTVMATKVKGTYGTATALDLANLKTLKKERINRQANALLQNYDWYTLRAADGGTAIPSAVSTHRDAVRSKQASMETSITNASDTPALETLYTYTTQEDGSTTRPLGELPTKDF